ncbi:MAG: DNA-3-methyladenine glycosylase [Betaproteobacteria bacterium RIFCSPLOWO2_02_FULL_67_26]|nr:MAG: DNA-3-methyladenine glycosylase [Betaproteobacteria bacterium RIFCSPLOWO2_02_FULL_67_26]
MRTPEYWTQATRELAERDAVLRELVGRFQGLALGSRGDAFSTLARSIVGQQISVKAAQSVWDRLAGRLGAVTPESLARSRKPALRNCGLSGQKAGYLKDLAGKFLDGTLDPGSWHALEDEALILELTQVRGIGRWTAEMYLMFHLARPDVLPLADLGLQRAMRLHYNRGRSLSIARMQRIGATWTPWRSVATWYLWRSLDPIPVEY